LYSLAAHSLIAKHSSQVAIPAPGHLAHRSSLHSTFYHLVDLAAGVPIAAGCRHEMFSVCPPDSVDLHSPFADGGLPNQLYLYVEGKAEIEKPTDMVTLRFDLVARNADQTKANQEVQA